MPDHKQQQLAHLRRESGPAKVQSGFSCWPTARPAPESAKEVKAKEKEQQAAASKLNARRKSFTLWGAKRDAAELGSNAAAPDASPSWPKDAAAEPEVALDRLSSQLFDLELSSSSSSAGGPKTPPAKGAGSSKAAAAAAAQPPAPTHRRVWSFGRKVAPATVAEEDEAEPEAVRSSADSSALLDTAQSEDLALSIDGSAASASTSGAGPAAPAAEQAKAQGYRRLWQSITNVRKGDQVAAQPAEMPDVTVEGLCRAVQRLKMGRPVMEAVQPGLPFLDSRAVAALLKELSKCGLPHRAAELFDWLRSLPPEDPLAKLADLYTYTTIISQCGGHQQLRRALELVGEMRARGIQCNIHTYSALMSVCVKCNECDLALDVYQQLLAEGCTPNLVTSNILIDIHGKTGQWEKAVEVLDALQAQGTTAEPRTYNTVISACAKSGQPTAAFQVYQRMLSDGVTPTSTTYTTLISAYGKAGQVEEALRIYEDMSRRGCERNVITYSSLISACDRAGRCDLALRLFVEMQQVAGVRPNVVTYNGVMSACGQAGLWHKAAELFETMLSSGCRPDAVSYSVLISAYERGGQWQRALQTFERMLQQYRPDACVYNCVLEALWGSGLVSAQAKAVQLATAALRQGHMRLTALSPSETTATAHTFAAVLVLLQRWVWDLREQQQPQQLPARGAATAVTGQHTLLLTRGKHCRSDQSYTHVAACLSTMFRALSAPLVAEPNQQGLRISAEGGSALSSWLASSGCTALLSPMASAAGGPVISAALLHEDAAAERQCAPAFAAVLEFEAGHLLLSDAYSSPAVATLRQELVTSLLSLGQRLQLPEEVICEAIQLCDRLLNRGAAPPSLDSSTAPLFAAGALLACARGAGDQSGVLCGQHLLLQLAGVTLPAALEAEQQLSTALHGDMSAISALRVLHLYLERLGCSLLALHQCELMQLMALTAANLASKAALSPAFVRYPPSLVAAACLAKARQGLGLHPAWPTSLERMTGYSAGQDAFATCCEVLQLLGLAA